MIMPAIDTWGMAFALACWVVAFGGGVALIVSGIRGLRKKK